MYETIEWIQKQVLKKGQNAFAYYNALYKCQPTCKDELYQPNDNYENCMVEKANCCYEETIRLFDILDNIDNKEGLENVVLKR
jgi:hypothetical protein